MIKLLEKQYQGKVNKLEFINYDMTKIIDSFHS